MLNKKIEELKGGDLAAEGVKVLISSLVTGIVIYLFGGFQWLAVGGVFLGIVLQILAATAFGLGVYIYIY